MHYQGNQPFRDALFEVVEAVDSSLPSQNWNADEGYSPIFTVIVLSGIVTKLTTRLSGELLQQLAQFWC